jgi:FkbM family methyltransferase
MSLMNETEWLEFRRACVDNGVLIERVIKSFYRSVLPRNGVAIDVGAHVGYHTLGLAEQLNSGVVVGCEANPKTYLDLLNAVKRSPGGGKVLTINAAIQGDSARDTVTFHVSDEHPGRSGIEMIWKGLDYKACTVTARTLDQIFVGLDLKRIDFIKCDVEGTEFEVFKGARRLLRDLRPIVVAEHAKVPSGCSIGEWLQFFRELGYEAVFPNGRVVTDAGFADFWYVFLFPDERAREFSEALAGVMARWRTL